MTAWKGLWRKEWQMMKTWIFGTLVLAVLLISISSSSLSLLVEKKIELSAVLGISLFMIVVITLCVPVSLLLNSLWTEWKHPDVWLHSPRSVYQLFGNKVLFALTVGIISMILPASFLHFYAMAIDEALAVVGTAKYFGMIGIFVFTIYTGAIVLVMAGLFLAVLYRVIKSYVRRGGFIVWLMVVLVLIWLFKRVVESQVYNQIAHLGRLNLPVESEQIDVGNFYFTLDTSMLYAGGMLLAIGFIGLLFFASAWLFEKKVRL